MYEAVLVPLDGSELAERALISAAKIAQADGAAIKLFSVVEDTEHVAERRAYLEAKAKELGPRASAMEPVVAREPAGAIAGAITDRPNVLLCMSTHGRTPVSRVFLGSVAGEVVRTIPGPVLAVGPHFDSARCTTLTEMVVPVDGSRFSEAVLPLAVSWAQALRLSMILVSVLPPSNTPYIGQTDVFESAYVSNLSSDLRRQGVNVQWEVLHGDRPAEAILDFISRRTSGCLLVMSTHGRSGLERVVMGSVAGALVARVPCPMLVIRPRDLTEG